LIGIQKGIRELGNMSQVVTPGRYEEEDCQREFSQLLSPESIFSPPMSFLLLSFVGRVFWKIKFQSPSEQSNLTTSWRRNDKYFFLPASRKRLYTRLRAGQVLFSPEILVWIQEELSQQLHAQPLPLGT
jgi:hypothetical protein